MNETDGGGREGARWLAENGLEQGMQHVTSEWRRLLLVFRSNEAGGRRAQGKSAT
jgi:hypothetical protein